jgi:hypothetical protein
LFEQFAKYHHLAGSETDVDPTQPGNIALMQECLSLSVTFTQIEYLQAWLGLV